MSAEDSIKNVVLIRTICTSCSKYGRCVPGIGYDGREIALGVDCGCVSKALKDTRKLREQGSLNVPYC